MKRSMMQVFVEGSDEAVRLYQEAFSATLLCAYPNDSGGYMHAELDVYGQVVAVSEITENASAGNTMMFCFHFGESGEEKIEKAHRVLKKDALHCTPVAPCDYSPCQFVLTDKFGVRWCLFV